MDRAQRENSRINLAIDGPAGAGKSTVARLVAMRLGYIYVDTGAMYRAVTWKALQKGIAPEQESEAGLLAEGLDIVLKPGPKGQQVIADGKDVTQLIRDLKVNQQVSQFAQIARVREVLVGKQKQMAARRGVVMDGRDIGTNVLPDAEVKVFLTASVEERAQRRFDEIKDKHPHISLAKLQEDIAERDRMDEEREISPLTCAKDAVLLDTTIMSIESVVEEILKLCKQHIIIDEYSEER